MLSLNGLLAGLLASVLPVAGEGVTVETKLAYFVCVSGGEL